MEPTVILATHRNIYSSLNQLDSMARLGKNMLLLVANLLIPAGVLLFMSGCFNKVVLMVIDGLRRSCVRPYSLPIFVIDIYCSDLVYAPESGFNFTQRQVD